MSNENTEVKTKKRHPLVRVVFAFLKVILGCFSLPLWKQNILLLYCNKQLREEVSSVKSSGEVVKSEVGKFQKSFYSQIKINVASALICSLPFLLGVSLSLKVASQRGFYAEQFKQTQVELSRVVRSVKLSTGSFQPRRAPNLNFLNDTKLQQEWVAIAIAMGLGLVLSSWMSRYVVSLNKIIKDSKKLKNALIAAGYQDKDSKSVCVSTPVGVLIKIDKGRIKDVVENESFWLNNLNFHPGVVNSDPNGDLNLFFVERGFKLEREYGYSYRGVKS